MSNFQVTWRGFVHDSTGYARAAREYILALDRQGVDVRIEPMSYGQPSVEISVEQRQRVDELIQKPLAEDKIKVLIYHAQPNGVDPDAERLKFDYVIVNTVWETTRVPDNWIANSNKADAIFVPSFQNKEALKDSGINVPVRIVPHGADYDRYKPTNPPLAFNDVKDKFTFLSVFQWQHRKAPEVLLKAYWQEFSNKDNVALIVKTYWGHQVNKDDQRGIINQIAHYKRVLGFGNDRAPVYVTTSLFSDEDLKGLYTLADCFVLPTRGEGVGLPYLESMCSGVPVIATNWGGSTDFLNAANSFAIDYDLLPTDLKLNEGISPNFNTLFNGSMKWAEPKLDSVRHQMRLAYENPELCKTKGINARDIMESMSWDTSGEIMKINIEKVIANASNNS